MENEKHEVKSDWLNQCTFSHLLLVPSHPESDRKEDWKRILGRTDSQHTQKYENQSDKRFRIF